MIKFAEIPVLVLGLGVILAALLFGYQIVVRQEPIICGTVWFPRSGGCEPKKTSQIEGWVSPTFQLGKNAHQDVTHNKGTYPVSIEVWSSSNKDGPWEKIDSLYNSNNGGFYGIWISDADKNRFRVQSGNISATSTYGPRDHWQRYFEGKTNYDYMKVWFRATAVFDHSLKEPEEQK